MSKKPAEIPPPPATGGTHTWDDKAGKWVTTDETVQPWDPKHPDNWSGEGSMPAGENDLEKDA